MIATGFANAETNIFINYSVEKYIKFYCEKYKAYKIFGSDIEPALIKAFIYKECELAPYSVRYEKRKKYDTNYTAWIPEEYKTNDYAYMSLGCMQILYGTARERGYDGDPEMLILPKYSIEYGIKQLIWLSQRPWCKSLSDVISAYNQGRPKKDNRGVYYNYVNYVKIVLEKYKEYKNGK